MKLGVIARTDARGLGNQTWEVARHLNPERILVIRVPGSEAQGFPPDLNRFPEATVLTIDEHDWTLPDDDVRDWLHGLDVVYSAETLYDWRIADWGRDLNVATVVHCNPEFYLHHRNLWPEPSVWWSATDWRIDHLPPGTVVVTMPAPTDRFTPHQAGDPTVLHIGGRAATGDRNGTDLVLKASAFIDAEVVVATQTSIKQPGQTTVVGHTANYWDLYTGHDVLLLPRRYGGLCLPVIEGCAAGLAPVMTDTTPNRTWPITPITCHAGPDVHLPAGRIPTVNASPEAVAEAVNNTLANLPERRSAALQWAQDNSWEDRRTEWLERLNRARTAKPRPAPTVTVVVPFTPGACPQRDRVWEWVRNRYQSVHPSWQIVVAPSEGEWSKAAALNAVMPDIKSDVVIVADADCVPDAADLALAVARVAAGAPWVVPHDNVLRLDETETERVLRHGPRGFPTPQRRRARQRYYTGIAGGGVVVIPRSAWDTAPMDARFVGWGYEDISWGAALDTLVGDHVRFGSDLIHLWHPPQPNCKQPSPESETLYQAYLAANGRRRRMAALVAGEEPDAPPEVEPVRFRSAARIMRFPSFRVRFDNDNCLTTSDPDLIELLRARSDVEEVA